MKILFTIYLVLLVSTVMQAQTNYFKRRSVNVTVGWQNFKFLDAHASPLAYGTNSIFPNIGVSFNRETDNSSFEIGVSGAIGNLNPVRFGSRTYGTKFSETDSFKYSVASQFYNVNIHGGYFRNIRSLSTDKINYYVGGIVNESAYYGDAVANMPWLFNEVDLSPAFKINYTPVTQHSFGIKFDFAALGLLTRLPYSLFAKSNKTNNVSSYFQQGTKLASVNKFRKANIQLTYQYQVAHHFAIGSEYRIKWIQYNYPKTLRAIDKNFDIKFSYTY